MLEVVGCPPLLLIEALSSADRGGMLVVGDSHSEDEEETSCDSSPNSPKYESYPWRQGQTRSDRRPENRRSAAWRDAPAGLCLSRREADHPRLAPAPLTSDWPRTV